jgi:hypothetical protein
LFINDCLKLQYGLFILIAESAQVLEPLNSLYVVYYWAWRFSVCSNGSIVAWLHMYDLGTVWDVRDTACGFHGKVIKSYTRTVLCVRV